MWCILAALFPATDERKTGKVSDYEEHLGKIDLRGISFPTPLVQVFSEIRNFVMRFKFYQWKSVS